MGKAKKKRKAKAQAKQFRQQLRRLHGHKVALTAFKRSDLEVLRVLKQDPAVARRFGWQGGAPNKQECLEQIQSSKKQFRRGKPILLAVRKRPDGKMLGIMQMRWGDDGRAELAWSFLPKHQDSKLEDRARRVAAEWCLDRGARRVWTIFPSS